VALPYTISFGYGASSSAEDVLLLAIPNVDTYIVRDIVLSNPSAGAALVSVYYSTGSANIALLRAQALPSGDSVHLDLRQVLPPGAQLRAYLGAPNLTVAVTGYWLKD
jgi:hypothetical protein